MNVFASGMVLVPWDYSEQCREALDLAVETARADVPIHVVYVSDSPTNFLSDVAWDSVKEEIIAKTAYEKFKKDVSPELVDRVKFETRFGDPGMEIVGYARDNQVSVIVMPTHGRSGIPRLLIGSVAERVIRMAPCPVFVVRSKLAAA